MSEMKSGKLTVKILEEIRDSIRGVGERVDQTNVRLDQTNSRLDQTNVRLKALAESTDERFETIANRLVEGEVRLATAILGLGGKLDEVRTMLSERLDQNDRLKNCEVEIDRLKQHTGLK